MSANTIDNCKFKYQSYNIILHLSITYFFLIFSTICLWNYIIYSDVEYNINYMNISKINFTSSYLLNSSIILYILYLLQYIYLSIRVFRHFIGIYFATLFIVLIYIILAINSIISNDCKRRGLYTCYEESNKNKTLEFNIDNTHLYNIRNIVISTCFIILIFNFIYSLINGYYNKGKKYYINQFVVLEIILLFVSYYAFGFLIIIVPLLVIVSYHSYKDGLLKTFITGHSYSSDIIEHHHNENRYV